MNLKFGLFSLLVLFAVSVIMTSCGKDPDVSLKKTENADQLTNSDDSTKILLPQNIAAQGEEAIKAYIENLTDEELTQYTNNYITMDFLDERELLDQVDEAHQEIGAFQDINLSNYLSNEEMLDLDTRTVTTQSSQTDERCWHCYYVFYYYCCGNVYRYRRVCVWR